MARLHPNPDTYHSRGRWLPAGVVGCAPDPRASAAGARWQAGIMSRSRILLGVLAVVLLAGAVVVISPTRAQAASWHPWGPLDTPGVLIASEAPAGASRANGVLDVFSSSLQRVYHKWYSPSIGWSGWGSIGGPPTSLARPPKA